MAGVIRDCVCVDGRAGRQTCSSAGTFSSCLCTGPSVDGGPGADAHVPPADAHARGPIGDFQMCNVDDDCVHPTSNCVAVTSRGGTKWCTPRCTDTVQCPFDTVCWPTTHADLGSHCWYSSCTATGGPCQLGADVGLPPTEQVPGYCDPVSDGMLGTCDEVGTITPGGTCQLHALRGGPNCDVNGVCEAPAGMVSGTCRRRCDPRTFTGCMTGEGCVDHSTWSMQGTATAGWCEPGVQACMIFGPPCSDPMMACAPSNDVRATGTCSPAGTTMIGQSCASGMTCAPGLWCDLVGMTCAQICDLSAPPTACAPLTCMATQFSAAGVTTLGWGTCR
jgi:hypothetical protein